MPKTLSEMTITLRLFSIAGDLGGFREQSVRLPSGSRAGVVLDLLEAANPRFAALRRSLRLAVNQTYVANDHPLSDGDEVAVIPPVSGG